MPKKKLTTRKVAICVSLSHASEREFLSGVFQHLDLGYSWKIQLIQNSPPFTAESLKRAQADGLDGIIISDARRQDIIPELVTTTIPLAVISGIAYRDNHPLIGRRQPTVAIHNDNQGISAEAVKHLLACGKYSSYGFVPADPHIVWSEERLSGFVSALQANNISAYVYDASKETLTDWLAALPKPTAIMAAYDERALDILAACEAAKLKVPKHVAIIGVDNDEYVCLHSTPPLTSVLPGHEEMGYRAATELEHLMSRKSKFQETLHITIPPRKVIARESTKTMPPIAMLIERIKAQIQSQATNGAKVSDIVRKVGVSRRLAELRFREIEGRTIADALATRRLEEATRLIRTSKKSFIQIAKDCGFSDAKHLAHRFKETFGKSPREFRNERPAK